MLVEMLAEVGKKLAAIRNETGKSQEDFYHEYLEQCSPMGTPRKGKTENAEASVQDWMKRLENGKITKFPLQVLPVYAKVGNTSIDAIMGSNTKKMSFDGEVKTYSDAFTIIFKLLRALEKNYQILIETGFSDLDTPVYSSLNYYSRLSLSVYNNEILANTVETWRKLSEIVKKDPSLNEMFLQWERGILQEYKDKPLTECTVLGIPF